MPRKFWSSIVSGKVTKILRQVNVDFVDNLNLIVVDVFRFARSHGWAKIDPPSTQTDRTGVKKVEGPTFF